MSKYIIELGHETWVATWKDVPPFTKLIELARKFRTKIGAKYYLKKVRRWRYVPNAKIIEVKG